MTLTIKEVCSRYLITADTLRYYEQIGAIPPVTRTAGGIRNYTEEDLRWVESAVYLRNAGVPVDRLVEYVRLFREGDGTLEARRDLLAGVKDEIQEKLDRYEEALKRLNHKIAIYDEAIETGVLKWKPYEEGDRNE